MEGKVCRDMSGIGGIMKTVQEIRLQNIRKSYGEKIVLEDLSFTLPAGSRTCLMGPSGSGKTTLFRILTGLESADSGSVFPVLQTDGNTGRKQKKTGAYGRSGKEQADTNASQKQERIAGPGDCRFGILFQENRLFENMSAIRNARLAAAKELSEIQIRAELVQILPADALDQAVKKLSGGMKRRVALARAVLASSDILLLDEPFTGLDEDTKRQTADWILKRQNGRILLFSSHQEEDAELMRAQTVHLC